MVVKKPAKKSVTKASPAIKAATKKTPAGKAAAKAAPPAKKRKSTYELKTKVTAQSVEDFVAAVKSPARRGDAETLLALFKRVTKTEPKLWGPSIIGYGKYAYTYESGHSGEFCALGFSPRKAANVLYVLFSGSDNAMLARLGKHKTGGSCLYVNKLADVDMDVLEEVVRDAWAKMKAKYGKIA